jgi:hypothetical protein
MGLSVQGERARLFQQAAYMNCFELDMVLIGE